MATATEISTRALRRSAVIDALQSPSAEDVATATEALNAMIASWEAEGLSGDIVPFDGRFEQAIVAMLGVRLCEEYGMTPGPVLARDADNGWKQIQAAFFAVPKSSFDYSLVYPGANYSGNTYNVMLDSTTDTMFNAWEASTAYAARDIRENGNNLYEVVTAGTSASSGGPTGTSSSITDGTVVWCWRRVTA